MVDGRTLIEKGQRLGAIHRASVLIDRIAALLLPDIPAVRLVVTRLDHGKPLDKTLQELQRHAGQHGIDLSINNIASFSENPAIVAGTGIADLISQTVAGPMAHGAFWPHSLEIAYGSRNALRVPAGVMFE